MIKSNSIMGSTNLGRSGLSTPDFRHSKRIRSSKSLEEEDCRSLSFKVIVQNSIRNFYGRVIMSILILPKLQLDGVANMGIHPMQLQKAIKIIMAGTTDVHLHFISSNIFLHLLL